MSGSTRRTFLYFLLAFSTFALSLGSSRDAAAAELEVRVVDRGGAAIPEAEVWVGAALEPGEARGARPWRMKLLGKSDERGELVVSVETGRWQVEARSMRLHAEPRFNPLQPPPVVTVREADESLEVEVVAWEGGLVVFDPEVDGLESRQHLVVRARHLDAPEAPIDIEMRELQEYLLPTGDWVFEPLVPGGHVLASFLVDGRPEPKTRVEATQVGLFVQSLLVAEARIVIDMRWIDENAQPTLVDFVAVEPGDLMGGEASRWAPPDERSFRGHAVSDSVYRATSIVPAGTWSIAPRFAGVAADPESHEVLVPPGASRRVEFELESVGEFDDLLRVRVHGESYLGGIEGAQVWLCEGGLDDLENCSAPRRTARGGGVNFWVPHESPRVVVVAADGYVPRVAEAPPQRPSDEWRTVEVRLDQGDRIEAEARDGNGEAVPGVVLSARQGSGPTGLPKGAQGLFDWSAPRRATTDASGRVSLGGLWESSVDVEARMSGATAAETFVDIRRPMGSMGYYVRRDSVEPDDRDPPFLTLRVRPAGSIGATLVCDDGGPLPKTASVRAFERGVRERDEREPGDMLAGAACVLEPAPIGGAFEERLVVGPLEEGAFHVAIRPTRHARWSWVDVETREDAPVIPVVIGQTTEIGLVTLRCTPSFEIEVFSAKQADALPRAELIEAEASYRELLPGVPPSEPRELLEDSRPDLLRITGFDEGPALLRARLTHPLLPREGVVIEQEATMRRGHLVPMRVSVPRFLGAIDYEGDAPRALEVRDETGESLGVYPVEEGRAVVPSLEEGTYSVGLCGDPDCSSVAMRLEDVRIEAGRFTTIR